MCFVLETKLIANTAISSYMTVHVVNKQSSDVTLTYNVDILRRFRFVAAVCSDPHTHVLALVTKPDITDGQRVRASINGQRIFIGVTAGNDARVTVIDGHGIAIVVVHPVFPLNARTVGDDAVAAL